MKYIDERIAELEAALANLRRQREACVHEQTASPGRTPFTLRENWINEENRRSGLIGLDQAIAGAEQQLRIFREMGG